jgi:hypothetical protein
MSEQCTLGLDESTNENQVAVLDMTDPNARAKGGCRFCGKSLNHSVVDLGKSPLCESFLNANQLNESEAFFPLQAFVCDGCFLVQVEEYVHGENIFGGEYAYFSSYSDSWLKHAQNYVEAIVPRLGLDSNSKVVELASNDGYLLKNFVERQIPCLGVEPADNVAEVAVAKGVPTTVRFFGTKTAQELVNEGESANLIIANNVLAHVPDLNDFVKGIKILLQSEGVITIEFPHLMRLIEENQFDTIYQEHYCYFSLHTLIQVFEKHGLTIWDVDELGTHGGSLRIYARHTEDDSKPISDNLVRIHNQELKDGVTDLALYQAFEEKVQETKRALLEFLIQAKREGKTVVGYGAPGKGNTLLNYCGIRTYFLDYVVDRNPYKHGKFLPGTHIPVFPTEKIAETKPDYVLILPWNLKTEIVSQLEYIREWGAKFVIPIPELTVS